MANWFGNADRDLIIRLSKPIGGGTHGHGWIAIEKGLVTCSECGRLPGYHIQDDTPFARKHAGTHHTMDKPIDIFKDGELYDTMGQVIVMAIESDPEQAEARDILRQALKDWNNATPQQRKDAMQRAERAADRAVSKSNWWGEKR